MLAVVIKSEYEYDIDIMKVIYMLAIHELGEAIIANDPTIDSKVLNNPLVKELLQSQKDWSAESSYAMNNQIHSYTEIPTFAGKSFDNKER